MKLKYEVNIEQQIKQILKNEFHLSKRLITKLKQDNRITKNGEAVFVNIFATTGDIIEVDIDFEEECENIVPTYMPLDIIYQDDSYIVINKPPKIETHPTCANFENTLANGLKYYYVQNNIKKKIRPVNRLDKETSGLIVFAKNEYIQEQLIQQMKSNIFKKEYIAIVEGIIEYKTGIINAPIKRKDGSILERCVAQDGDVAITDYEVIKTLKDKTIVKCKLKTGRTHQIRVHMEYIGHPIISDFLYGTRNNIIDRQALHSYKIQFIHPITKKKVVYELGIPEDMKKIINI